jgi:hypothetical protein
LAKKPVLVSQFYLASCGGSVLIATTRRENIHGAKIQQQSTERFVAVIFIVAFPQFKVILFRQKIGQQQLKKRAVEPQFIERQLIFRQTFQQQVRKRTRDGRIAQPEHEFRARRVVAGQKFGFDAQQIIARQDIKFDAERR